MDDDLVARLNALKAPAASLGSARSSSGGPTSVAPAASTSRLSAFSSAVEGKALAAADEDAELDALAHALPSAPSGDDEDLAALLESLGGDDLEVDYLDEGGKLERDAAALLDQARRHLPEDDDRATGEEGGGGRETDDDGRKARSRGSGDDSDDDGEGGTAASTLERALAEAALSDGEEHAPGSTASGGRGGGMSPPVGANNTQRGSGAPGGRAAGTSAGQRPAIPTNAPGSGSGSGAGVEADEEMASLLATLSKVPSLPSAPLDDEEEMPADMADRMALLKGIRGPSNFPAVPRRDPRPKEKELPPPPRKPGQGWGIAGYDDGRDDDLDSWCSESCQGQLCSFDPLVSHGWVADSRRLQQGRRTAVPRLRWRSVLPRMLE